MQKRPLASFIFQDKNYERTRSGRNISQYIKGYMRHVKLNIILEKEKLAFSLKSEPRQGYTLCPLLLRTVLEVLASTFDKGKKKGIQIGKEG